MGQLVKAAAILYRGVLYTGETHWHCDIQIAEAKGVSPDEVYSITDLFEEGFVAYDGTFLTREEAYELADQAERDAAEKENGDRNCWIEEPWLNAEHLRES